MTKLILILCLTVACLGSRDIRSEPSPRNEHTIVDGLMYSSYWDWRRSPFYRITTDLVVGTPVFVLVDNLGYGCVVPGEVWALSPPFAACPGKWRSPRKEQ